MRVIGHLINDIDSFHAYFDEDAPPREMMFFIENHTSVVFTGRLSHIPTAVVLPLESGGTCEAGILADIMDMSESTDDPVLHLVLERIVIPQKESVLQ